MQMIFKVAAFALFFVTTSVGGAMASPQAKKTESNRGLDFNNIPIAVIEGAQKAVPNIAFTTVEKQSSWRRGQYFRIWGMDGNKRQIYLEVSASGKVITRPKVIKEKETEKEEIQTTGAQTKEVQPKENDKKNSLTRLIPVPFGD